MRHAGKRGGGLIASTMRFSTLLASALVAPCATVCAAGLSTFVEPRVAVEDATQYQPAAAKVSAQVDMSPLTALLVTLTPLLSLKASPRNPLLETLTFTSPSAALTAKTQHPRHQMGCCPCRGKDRHPSHRLGRNRLATRSLWTAEGSPLWFGDGGVVSAVDVIAGPWGEITAVDEVTVRAAGLPP